MSPLAVGIVLLSAALHATWNFLVKTSRHPRAFVVVRSPLVVLFCLAALPFFELREVPPAAWWLILASGGVHLLYFIGLAGGYTVGDISLVYPIARSAPAFVPLFAVWLLGERLSAGGAIGIAIVVVAMWIVHTGGSFTPRAFVAPGVGYAYFTLATVVTYSLVDKQAIRLLADAPWTGAVPRPLAFLLLEEALCAVAYLAVMAPRLPREALVGAVRTDWPKAMASAVLDSLSYVLVLHVYATEQVSYVVAVRQTSVIAAVVLGNALLKEPLGRARLVGASAMVAGVAVIALFA